MSKEKNAARPHAGQPATAADRCEDWCRVDQEMHDEHRDKHEGIVRGLPSLEPLQRIYVALQRPYLEGLPLAEADQMREARVVLNRDDEELLQVSPSLARSLAAALVAAAERAETAVTRSD